MTEEKEVKSRTCVNLTEYRKPEFCVRLSDDDVRVLDPFVVMQRLGDIVDGIETDRGAKQSMERLSQIKDAFGIPELTEYQGLVLVRKLVEFVSDLASLKNA